MRYAIYYAPPAETLLAHKASSWLGRCTFTGEAFAPQGRGELSAAEMAYNTAAARRYGFHATLMAPFTLASEASEQQLIDALAAYSSIMQPFSAHRLVVGRIDGFFALVPEKPDGGLNRLANDVVATFDRFRAPLDERERERRGVDLSHSQLRNLLVWGYPHVFEDFRFHMTLTGRIREADSARMRRAIDDHFGDALDGPLEVGSLVLFLEPEPGAPFIIRSFHEFSAARERKTA